MDASPTHHPVRPFLRRAWIAVVASATISGRMNSEIASPVILFLEGLHGFVIVSPDKVVTWVVNSVGPIQLSVLTTARQ